MQKAGRNDRCSLMAMFYWLANCLPSCINDFCYDLDRLGTRSAINLHIGNVDATLASVHQ